MEERREREDGGERREKGEREDVYDITNSESSKRRGVGVRLNTINFEGTTSFTITASTTPHHA